MSFFVEVGKRRVEPSTFGSPVAAKLSRGSPQNEAYEDIVTPNDFYQRATVCRGVFGKPVKGFAAFVGEQDVQEAEKLDNGEKWNKLADAVAGPNSTFQSRNKFQGELRSLSAQLLKYKKLGKIYVEDQKKWVDCDIIIKEGNINQTHVFYDWHVDGLQTSVGNTEAARSLPNQVLVAIVALKDIPGTKFYQKHSKDFKKNPANLHELSDNPSDCRDPGDARGDGLSHELCKGDLNLHTMHWTCHKTPQRPGLTGVMHISFNLPYECFDQVVKNLVAKTMDEAKTLRVKSFEKNERTSQEEGNFTSSDIF